MVTEIKGLNDGIVGFHVSGIVKKEDYIDHIVPLVEKNLSKYKKISVLYVIDDDFDHYAWQAMLEDAKVGFKHPFSWDKIAIVADVEWILNAVKYLKPLMPYDIKTFAYDDLEAAKKWIQEEKRNLSIHLDEDKEILTLEPYGSLTQADINALQTLMDGYFSIHEHLKGVMIKTQSFPGWDSFSALKEHVAFVKNHHQHIEKLAFVTDSTGIDVFQYIAGVILHPQIKEFPYELSAEAYAWLENTQNN